MKLLWLMNELKSLGELGFPACSNCISGIETQNDIDPTSQRSTIEPWALRKIFKLGIV